MSNKSDIAYKTLQNMRAAKTSSIAEINRVVNALYQEVHDSNIRYNNSVMDIVSVARYLEQDVKDDADVKVANATVMLESIAMLVTIINGIKQVDTDEGRIDTVNWLLELDNRTRQYNFHIAEIEQKVALLRDVKTSPNKKA